MYVYMYDFYGRKPELVEVRPAIYYSVHAYIWMRIHRFMFV